MANQNIDINTEKLKKSYSLKGKKTVNIIGELAIDEVKISGSTVTIYLTDGRKFALTNISNPNDIMFGEATLQDFYNSYPPEWLPEDEEKCAKLKKVTGTVFDDEIDVSAFYIDEESKRKAGLSVSGLAGDDIITGTDYADNINGGAGNDTIIGGLGDDKLTGGKGSDTFVFSSAEGADTITDADVNDAIEITDVESESLRYAKNGKNLEIFFDDNYNSEEKIVVKNYFKTKAAKRVDTLYASDSTEESYVKLSAAITAPIDPDDPESKVNLAISGSGKINGTDNSEIIIGSKKADTINAKGGDDVIFAGSGNDKITGGKGTNTYVFKTEFNSEGEVTGFGNNTVTLTAGENAILDLSSIEDISEEILDFSFVKNNLVIKTGDYGQVTIANFKKKDTTGENGSVLLKISDDEEGIIDLKTKLFHTETTKDYKGAWYSEDIDATGALTGLKIAGGKGNDVITVNKGGNTFIFNHGDGEDTLVNAGSEDVIQFENAVNLSYQKVVSEEDEISTDLRITYNDEDSVTIKGYFDKENVIDTIRIKNGKQYDVISIKEVAIIGVDVTEDYEKTADFHNVYYACIHHDSDWLQF